MKVACHNYPRTAQELRCNADPEVEKLVRGKRRRLPTNRDDKPRAAGASWKRYRSHQYR